VNQTPWTGCVRTAVRLEGLLLNFSLDDLGKNMALYRVRDHKENKVTHRWFVSSFLYYDY
jgi:hypothetical protein